MRTFLTWKYCALSVLIFSSSLRAGGVPSVVKALKGSVEGLHVDSVVVVEDHVFYGVDKSKLDTPYATRGRVTFGIDEGSGYFLKSGFTASVLLRITRYNLRGDSLKIDTTLRINYDSGGTYLSKMSYVLAGAYRIKVEVKQMNTNAAWDVWKVLQVEAELSSDRRFKFQGAGIVVPSVSTEVLPASTDHDQLVGQLADGD